MLFPAMTCMGPTAFIVLHGKPITLDASLDVVLLFIFMNKQPSSSKSLVLSQPINACASEINAC